MFWKLVTSIHSLRGRGVSSSSSKFIEEFPTELPDFVILEKLDILWCQLYL